MHCGETYLLPPQARRIVIGLSWEAVKGTRERRGRAVDLDVDASCTLLSTRGSVVDTVYARHPAYCPARDVQAVHFYEDPNEAPFAPPLCLFHASACGATHFSPLSLLLLRMLCAV